MPSTSRALLTFVLVFAAPAASGAERLADPAAPQEPAAGTAPGGEAPASAFAVSVELGWNALAGSAIEPSWRPRSHPWLAVDLAAGLSLMGPKAGARARWIDDRPRTAQTFGVGLQVARGMGYDVAEGAGPALPPVLFFGLGRTTHVSVGPTAYVQLVWGAQVRRGSFDATFLVGWSQVVAGHEVRADAPLNAGQQAWIDEVTGSGLVLSVSLGAAPRVP